MPQYAYVILGLGWILWMVPFSLLKRPKTPATLDRRARWGIILVAISYAFVWSGPFWTRRPAEWRIWLSAVFLLIGCLLSWTATRALGRHWRIDAGLDPDHELVRSGPYRLVRHPIYASMLAMFLGVGLMIARFPLFAAALPLFLIGTEIRVRVEDSLLAARFGDQFQDYQRHVAAYIPGVR